MSGRVRRFWGFAAGAALGGIAVVSIALAASKAINLDDRTANAAESAGALNILSSFPAKIETKVTNRAVGDAYTFRWPSAGPGGFSSQLAPGTAAGVGVTWVWQTAQTIYSVTGTSCANDVCFTRVSGPDAPPDNSPAWAVPGRTLVPNSVTLSNASLTSSLITFFSPPQTLVEATSSVHQLATGEFAYGTTYTNHTSSPVEIDVPPGPPGCCAYENQLNCDGTCVDYLWDNDNCGACGNDCSELDCGGEGGGFFGEGDGGFCFYGYCECGKGKYEILRPTPEDHSTVSTKPAPGGTVFGAKPGLVGSDVIVGAHPFGGNGEEDPVDPAPLCETAGYKNVIPPGGSVTTCEVKSYLPKEIPGLLTACGTSIPDGEPTCPGGSDPASQGTFMQFVADLDKPIPTSGAYLTPFQIHVQGDSNGDGVLQPGESAHVFVYVLNVGPDTYTGPSAVLTSPPVDLTPDNGVNDPELVTISQPASPYSPDVAGVIPVPGGDCNGPFAPGAASVNVLSFDVEVPAGHTGDVIRPFVLSFDGLVDGTPTQMSVPISLGIGSAEADLEITKGSSPASPAPGANLTYTLTVTNHGPLDATSVSVTDDIPAGTSFVSAVGTGWVCSPNAGTLTCTRPSLAKDATSAITLVVKVTTTCPTPASISNTAKVTSATPDELTDNNTATAQNTVNAPSPVVDITQPVADQLGLPPLQYPVTIKFQSSSPSPIARETVSLDGCLLWDGLTYGDHDGLLTDEYLLQTTKPFLCQAMARCGYTVLYYPKIKVAVTDNCGRTGTDEIIYRKNLLKTEVCAR